MPAATTGPYRPFQDGLRAAGRYLDENARRLYALLVVDEGIVLTLTASDIHKGGEAVLLTHDDLRDLATQARFTRGHGNAPRSPDPLFPTAYEDFLRALGATAATQGWTNLRLVRLGDSAVLRHGDEVTRQEIVLESKDVEQILNHAFSQRGHGGGDAP